MKMFGKHAPRLSYKTPLFHNYMTTALPPAPASFSVLPQISQKLSIGINDIKVLFPMDGNDQYGDCTCAALAHAISVYNGMVGKNVVMQSQDVVNYYLRLTGGQDTGLDELTVLQSWQKAAVDGEQIQGFVAVDITNRDHLKSAISLFGGLYIGFQVQASAESAFDNRQWWEPDTLTQDGHAVYVVGYDAESVTVLTWGDLQTGTWSWWDQCVDEAYAILPPQAALPNFDPGFNLAQLQADLQAVGAP